MVASQNWIGAARLVPMLHRAGASVTAVAPQDAYLLKVADVTHAVGPNDSAEQIIAKALQVVEASEPFDYIQIADDPLLWFLADRDDQEAFSKLLSRNYSPEIWELLTHKHVFTEQLAETPFKVVPGWAAFNHTEALNAADRLGYPVILKPSRGLGGASVQKFDSSESLQASLEASPMREPFVVQRFIEGKVAMVEALFDRGEPKCWATWYKSKTMRGPFAASSARELLTLPDVEEQLKFFGETTGFHGFLGLDLMYQPSTRDYYFIEVNPRQATGYLFGWCAGADFSAAFDAMLSRRLEQYPPIRDRLDGLRIRAFPVDIDRAIYNSDALSLLTAPFGPAMWRDLRSQNLRLILQGYGVIRRSAAHKIRHISSRFTGRIR